jgi:hypothetical protein
MAPIEAAVSPFPSEETTPPVTKIKLTDGMSMAEMIPLMSQSNKRLSLSCCVVLKRRRGYG